jgi:hypothetical protein
LVGKQAAAALDSNPALDLPEGVLAAMLAELVTFYGRLEVTLDRLAEALDPNQTNAREVKQNGTP